MASLVSTMTSPFLPGVAGFVAGAALIDVVVVVVAAVVILAEVDDSVTDGEASL